MAPKNLERLTLQQKIAAGAAAVVLLSAFLPWVSFWGVSASGIRGGGKLTLILALAGLALIAVTAGVFKEPQFAGKGADIGHIVVAALVALIGFINTVDLGSLAAIGLYLTLLAGLAWTGVAVWQFLLNKQTAPGGVGGPQNPA